MAYSKQTTAETAAIGLIHQQTLVRSLSPELMLVDPELAERARELLREPHEANGKVDYMSALGTHEITAGMSLGLEPPLSPPVVRGPMSSAMPTGDGLAGLPTPPPAIRPPESAIPAPAPQVEVPQPQPVAAPAPAVAPAPVPPEAELPAMAPAQEAETPAEVHDYFAAAEMPESTPEIPPVELPQVAEPAPQPEIHAIPLMAPASAPVEEPAVELPAMAPPEPELTPELAPAAFVAPQPVELAPVAPVAPEPAPEPTPEPIDLTVVELEPVAEPVQPALPVVEPVLAAEPVEPAVPVAEPVLAAEPVEPALPIVEPVLAAETAPATELEELFAPKRTDFQIVVRLKEAEGVAVGSFRDFGTAMEGAQEVIEQFSTATEGQWPFYAGRFIRPDLIVSVDVVEGDGTEG
jgi:hypothetical protein